MTGYATLVPELLLLVAAAWAMFADRLPGKDRGSAIVGAAASVAAAVVSAFLPTGLALFGGLMVVDGVARFASLGICVLTALWLLWVYGRGSGRVREAVALALFASLGGVLMAKSAELITLLLAIELATLPAYVLIGYRRHRIEGLEGALKYFLLSMLTTLVMLYGMSLLYGVTGTTRYGGLDLKAAGALGLLGLVLTIVGMFAKLSAAPFHYWAPDAYEGAEPWTVSYVSTVPKVAGAIALVRLSAALAASSAVLGPVLLIGAVASMLLGNLAALTQSDLRRMMAYSGVAHTGYLLLGVAALTPSGLGAAAFYAVAYAIPSLGVMLLAAEEGPLVSDFNGLAQRRPAAAWFAVLMLVSLIGIPPLVGFFGKLYLFGAALDAGLTPWVVVAVLMSVVSAGYYLRVVRAAFFGTPGEDVAAVSVSRVADFAVFAAVALALGAGIGAGALLAWLGVPLP
jgi:NADH-quinone oxidoreductase subunit N